MVDAFTSEPFRGNTAGVILMSSQLPPEKMQMIATQNNFPATAFLHLNEGTINLSWFTPKKEIALCGHATLAAAHVLFSEEIVDTNSQIIFQISSGSVNVSCDQGWIRLDFPSFTSQDTLLPDELTTLFSGSFKSSYKTGDRYLVGLSDESAVRRFVPDFKVLENYKCIITAAADSASEIDFVSRFFDVPDGVSEDPVTGSAHCSLGPFWAAKLKKNSLVAYQASARGGYLKLELRDSRVIISGQAVTVVRGEMPVLF
jgi:PhzF family phenazine biosynthesis protein